MNRVNGNENEIIRMTDEQAQKQRLLDILSYHQTLKTSQQDSKICVAYGISKNISWLKSGDELNQTLERFHEDSDNDCWTSIAEFSEEKLNKNYVTSIKIFYIRLPKTQKFNPSTANDGKNIILEYCVQHEIPTPSVIVYDGNEYCLKWILREPLNGKRQLDIWKKIQQFLAERFFFLLDEKYYLDDGKSPKRKFINAHDNVTAMLRVPGFLNSQKQSVDLFNHKIETQVIFSSEARYSASEVAFKLHLLKHEILNYRFIKGSSSYLPKKSPSRKKKASDVRAEVRPLDVAQVESIKAALFAHHQPREEATFVYVQKKNIEKHTRTDRQYYYDSYSIAELEKFFMRRSDINICDFWATAAEYHWNFYKLKEKTVYRTKENGEQYTEIRRSLPKREKWIEAIQLNFLHLNFRNSELGYIPTIEEAKNLIYARCEMLNLPKPAIVDTGDNGETLELRWVWQNAMKNCGERDDERIKYPRFNRQFDDMQDELFRLFWDFGVDEKKLKATSMLCVVGTPNTKTGNLRCVVSEASEILTYEEFAKRLDLNFGDAHETSQPKYDVAERKNSPVMATTPSRELDSYAEISTEFDEPTTEARENNAQEIQEVSEKSNRQPEANRDDLSRLHSGSNYWVCLCTENKNSKGERGKWTEYWTPADKVREKLVELRDSIPDFDEFNIYVSQLEFFKLKRDVNSVAAFRVCFVDVDGKLTNEKYSGYDRTADGWKNLVLNFCAEKKLPTPSEMVFSGNGVHVKYFFNRLMTRNEFSRWERLEMKLAEIFKEIGADSHSKDGARVLRVEGTLNQKPETEDRDVRVIFTGADYDFEEFASEIEALSRTEIQQSEPKPAKSKPSKKSAKPTSKTPSEKPEPERKSEVSSDSEKSNVSRAVDTAKSKDTLFYVHDATTGGEAWITKSYLMNYLEELKKLNENHKLECSIVEYKSQLRYDRAKAIKNLFLSYVVLNDCPGENLEEKIAKIKERCREYRGVGIPEPNRILEDGNNLILIWRYSKDFCGRELPGIALPRWKVTQEYLNYHFASLGAVKISAAQKSTTLLPVPGFAGVKLVYENSDLKYLFDDIAKAVLPFSQKEVAEYFAVKKAYNRSVVLEELTELYVARRKSYCQTSRFSPALKIFNDIVRLLRIRAAKGSNGEVPEGRRELCVFIALDFAVFAGFIKRGDKAAFNELAQRLINLCGVSFTSDCSPETMMTLRGKFLNETPVYRFHKKTIIETLEITPEEQAELDILKLDEPKQAKRKKIPEWEILGVSHTTYYRHKKEAEQVAATLREFFVRYYVTLWILDKCLQLQTSSVAGFKNSTYYERARGVRVTSHFAALCLRDVGVGDGGKCVEGVDENRLDFF